MSQFRSQVFLPWSRLAHPKRGRVGTTGLAILCDIVRGERDPYKLAMHKHSRIRVSRQEIARSLEGTWRQELLFVLEQSLDLYQTYQQKIQT